jgi:branched-chain amino acid transport system substrate-binding protein
LLLLLSSCTSIQPIVKIGLIAPFEGLYRQSGYTSLDAMRQAIEACTPPGLSVLPVALDDSGDPTQTRRAAQKLLADPATAAIVGPLLVNSIPAAAEIAATQPAVPWYVPPLIAHERTFNAQTPTAWLTAQVDYIAQNASTERVLLAALPPAWEMNTEIAVPVLRVDDVEAALAALTPGDTILWLGAPDEGARWLARLQSTDVEFSFWQTSQAGIDVFMAHETAARANSPQQEDHAELFWLLWTNSEYNILLQSDDPTVVPSDAMSNLTYHATCAALQALGEDQRVASPQWELQSRPIRQR